MKFNTLVALTATTLVLAACGGEKAEVEAQVEEKTETAAEGTAAAPEVDAKKAGLQSVDQRISYIVGVNMATQFGKDGIDIDVKALSLAIEDVKAGNEPRLSEEENRQTITELQERAQAKQQAEIAAVSEKNATEGAAYLAENGVKEGVVTTTSGLQYKEVVAGEGESPSASDTVTVHYKGTLIDGTVFDSSYDRGQPATFPVGGVIPGWIEALQLMNVGDKFELVIPADLAYGPNGTGAEIGPNSTLLFDVELIEIIKPEAPAEAAPAPEAETPAAQ